MAHPTHVPSDFGGASQSSGGEPAPLRTDLSKRSQQVAHQQDHKNCAEPNAGASACAPPAVAEVSSAPAENQQQNNNENDQHLASPFAPGMPGL